MEACPADIEAFRREMFEVTRNGQQVNITLYQMILEIKRQTQMDLDELRQSLRDICARMRAISEKVDRLVEPSPAWTRLCQACDQINNPTLVLAVGLMLACGFYLLVR